MKLIKRLKNFLRTDEGRQFLQYAYSFGAAIVIFGALIKVLHLWGIWGNIIFGIGMAMECIVFILYGLDRPARDYEWEKVFPVLESDNTDDRPDFSAFENFNTGNTQNRQPLPNTPPLRTNSVNVASATPQQQIQETPHCENGKNVAPPFPASFQTETPAGLSNQTEQYEKQMEILNRNLSGLNTIYEIQLKTISGQIDTLDRINRGLGRIKEMYEESVPDSSVFRRETEKMTEQIQQLNQIYARLIQAMTNNSISDKSNA